MQLTITCKNIFIYCSLSFSVLRPSPECGSEMWEGNTSQGSSLESIYVSCLEELYKHVVGCSSTSSNEVVGGDIIESVDSISKDERGFPLTQYITNGRISRARYIHYHAF